MTISRFSDDSSQDPNIEQVYVKRIWNEKVHSGVLSHDGSLLCQAPPAYVSSLRPAPPASTHNSNGNSSFSSLPKPLATSDPKLSDEPLAVLEQIHKLRRSTRT